MKITREFKDKIKYAPSAGKFNTWLFLGISLTWGHMLDLISPWWLPLTIVSIMLSYGSEIKADENANTLSI